MPAPLTIWDFILLPIYLVIIYFVSNGVKNKNIGTNRVYKYYLPGLWVKIMGGLALTFIYIFYYKGGDTIGYFHDIKLIGNLFYTHPIDFFKLLLLGSNNSEFIKVGTEDLFLFYGTDYYSFFFVRLMVPLSLFGLQSYLVTVVLLAWVSYFGIWRLYLIFTEFYPGFYKLLAVSILFVPSILFWGSGLLKDTVTLSSMAFFIYCFYKLSRKTHYYKKYIFLLLINALIIISIKPYIFIALAPSCLVWLSFEKTKQIQNIILRSLATPINILIGIFIGILILSLIGNSLGKYSAKESIIKKAQLTQQDLIRSEQYGQNYYDIGKFDNSFSSILSKVPNAIITGLYRPFIWETKNIVMLFSGIENLILLLLTLFSVFYVGPLRFIRYIINNPLLFFCFIFTLVFSFSVGLTTANYGALVRYRIPELPFFISGLIIILYHNRKDKMQHLFLNK